MSFDRDKIIKIHSDPVLFAWHYFKWKPRPHQEKILRQKKPKIILRICRRGGKTEALILKMLHLIYTNRNFTIVVMTPRESQIIEIWETMKTRFINKSPAYKASVERMPQRPWRIELKNGSMIKFITAGSKSGGEGDSVRGMGGDIIVLDEMDRLADNDIISILGLLNEARPSGNKVQLWCSSTPTGKRSFFYTWCTEPEKFGFWHIHVAAPQAMPDWGPEKEAEMRLIYGSGYAYQQELMAEFSDEASAYFSKDRIDFAFSRWDTNYSDIYHPTYGYMQKSDHYALRTMGVDWDKVSSGPQIVIIEKGLDGETGDVAYKVIYRHEIPRAQFTLLDAVKKIIELNRIFNPRYIYVDRGFGDTQIELLHKAGEKDRESGLIEKVKGIAFGGTIEIKDPITKQLVKQKIKLVMVSQLRQAFEQGLLIMNDNDQEMKNQFLNYNIVRLTNDGMPVFTRENEHSVDALMLAYFAMVREIEKFNKSEYLTTWKKCKNIFSDTMPIPGQRNIRGGFNVDKWGDKLSPGEVSTNHLSGAPSIDWCQRGTGNNGVFKRSFTRKFW